MTAYACKWKLCMTFVVLLLVGCATAQSAAVEPAASPIEPQSRGRWILRAQRQVGERRTEAAVVLLSDITPPSENPHSVLAGTLAFLRLAVKAFEADDVPLALAAARAGHDEIKDYAPAPPAVEHTDMKRQGAEGVIKDGRVKLGTRGLINILKRRVRMYLERHRQTVQLIEGAPYDSILVQLR